MSDLLQRRREAESQLNGLIRQVDEMDARVRAYLADRERKPHPRHMEFIERIQQFRLDNAISTKHLETLLDNLQWKVYYYRRSWQQLWENAEAIKRREAKAAEKGAGNTGNSETTAQAPGPHKRPVYSVDRLWNVQQERLQALNVDPTSETKDEFVKRIKQTYGRLASEKKEDEEIVMMFDKDLKRCTLEVKKKKNA